MDLEGLLNASLALEKRIATDRALRKYFAAIWGEVEARKSAEKPVPPPLPTPPLPTPPLPTPPKSARELTLQFPAEMCEWLELAASSTGRTPAEILEECFVEHYLKKLKS